MFSTGLSRITFVQEGAATPYSFMAEAFEVIASTTKRQEKASVLIEAFRTILASNPADLIAAVRLTANELSPPHEGLELGLGEATLKDVSASSFCITFRPLDGPPSTVDDAPSLEAPPTAFIRSRDLCCRSAFAGPDSSLGSGGTAAGAGGS